MDSKHTEGQAIAMYSEMLDQNWIQVNGKNIALINGSDNYSDITADEAKANAARIVKAWNDYDALNQVQEIHLKSIRSLEQEAKELRSDIAQMRNEYDELVDNLQLAKQIILAYDFRYPNEPNLLTGMTNDEAYYKIANCLLKVTGKN